MEENFIEKIINNLLQDRYIRGDSEKWANWMSELTATTCFLCVEGHGTLKDIAILDGQEEKSVNKHQNCRCLWVPIRTKKAGTATNIGKNGAYYSLFYNRTLPSYYVTKKQAEAQGWISKKRNLAKVCPNKMIGGDLYKNKERKLPSAPNRIWYEADINYISGERNRQRILYSNDGLIFVTYDHYQTFHEITA